MKRLSWLILDKDDILSPTVLLLVFANLVPLYGLFFLHWQIFPILLLFWIENVIVGIFNILKMLLASPSNAGSWVAKIAMIPFFCFHYGMFTLVHGVFVFVVFGGFFTSGAGFPDESSLFEVVGSAQLGWAILALFLSHLVSFVFNYIGKGEYKKAALQELMGQPYGRVVILHLTILIGGFLVMSLGSPVFALLILVFLKIFVDVQAHVREHKKYAQRKEVPIRESA